MNGFIGWLKKKIKVIRHTLLISRVSMYKDYVFAAIKIIFSIFTQSYFLSVSGLYSICIGFAKGSFFKGKSIGEKLDPQSHEYKQNEYKHLARMASFILIGSIIYVVYMTRLFFISSTYNYGEIPAITIAAVSFTEIALSIIHLKKAKGALFAGLRCVNLSSAFTAIVLTQVAILSFADETDCSVYNAISGTIFGCLCFALAIVMFCYYFSYKKKASQTETSSEKEGIENDAQSAN